MKNIFKKKKKNKKYQSESDLDYLFKQNKQDGAGSDENQSDSDIEPQTEYEPLDRDIIEQAMEEERQAINSEGKKSYVESCLEQVSICSRRIEDAKREYRMVNSYLDDIQIIENLQPQQKENVEYYARRIKSLKEDKDSMKSDGTRLKESRYMYFQKHEDEMGDIIKDIHDCENDCQRLKHDLNNIEGEKFALKYERNDAMEKLQIIRKLSVIAALLVVISIIVLVFLQVSGGDDYSIGYYLVALAAAVFAAGIVIFYQKNVYNLKLAEKKLNKAIGLLNKYKLLYVNSKSRLDFFYEQNDVKNSYELSEQWGLYLTMKKERQAMHINNDNTYKAIEGLISELESAGLYDPSVWASQSEAIIDNKQMTEIRHTLNIRRQKLQKSIEFNTQTGENAKERINQIVKKNPAMAREILEMIDREEKNNGTIYS